MSEIEQIVVNAISLAKQFQHEYVTIEHVAVVVLDDEAIKGLCYDINADGGSIQDALMDYLEEECEELVVESPDMVPAKTQMLERVFNRALTQALFQGRRGINQIDLLLSILSEDHSAAASFGIEFGLDKVNVAAWLQEAVATAANQPAQQARSRGKDNQPEPKEVVAQFCVNMTERSDEYDDVIGRRNELRDLVQTLARKKKSNAVMVGPSGVGKTAIVEGLAKLIREDNVPDTIKGKTVWLLDMGKLVAGTKYRGDFEERIKALAEALENIDDAIVFIDEIHTIIGAGQTGQGSMDAGNMLKPSLTSGKLKVIGATTDEEYRKMFDKEAALARRFTKIQINEPTREESHSILKNALVSYEAHHKVGIRPEAAVLAVDLSAEYIFNKKLPDKAFDIMDRACAYNRIRPENDRLEWIGESEIREEVSRLTGIPTEHLGSKHAELHEVSRHVQVQEYLSSTVFGQDEAIQRVVDSITISIAGLKDPSKPVASYLFTGPTGVGKTEMAKRLAQSMKSKLVRFDMAEFQERHTVSKLIGSPPGYVGHGDGKAGDGLLINALEDTPNCILLLDEVEKAHPDIMTVLLALLDEGVITSSTGKKVSGKNAIIILTSNLGAREGAVKQIGFGDKLYNSKAVSDAINNFFAPEFRNRLDGIIQFNPLVHENMMQIVDKFLSGVQRSLAVRKIEVRWTDELKTFLEKEGFDPAMGARPLARLINERVKLPLARFLLDQEVDYEWISVDYINNEVTITSGSAQPALPSAELEMAAV